MAVHSLFGLFMVQIGAMNDALMCVRPKLAEKFKFTK